jgi:hypothetical protein
MKRTIHTINGERFTVAFVAGGWWYLHNETSGELFRSPSVELRPKMYLEYVKKGA